MINELYGLSTAMKDAGLTVTSWDRKYKPIPNIRSNAPCVRIELCDGKVVHISSVEPELGSKLRKYGNNQGSYPCMNLAPLFRIDGEENKKKLDEVKQLPPESLDEEKLSEIQSWCTHNNWGKKYQSKYNISMVKIPKELSDRVPQYKPLSVLVSETQYFEDSEILHEQLKLQVFSLLRCKEQVQLALQVLFYQGKNNKDAVDDYGTLSVALESTRLLTNGSPAVSTRFVEELNMALQESEPAESSLGGKAVDAFGISFDPIEEPMPEVKLAGGFDVKLRSMFKEQRCQTRYARIEDGSYPISQKMRKSLHAALNWIGQKDKREIYWINSDKNEVLFAYPSQLPKTPISFTRSFGSSDNSKTFQEQSKRFLEDLKSTRKEGADSRAEGIQLFIIRKVDKARTKVIYSRQTNAYELEQLSEQWTIGCSRNLPKFSFGQPRVPFPLNTADVFNGFWKQDGTPLTNKYKPVPKYHGMELLMEPAMTITKDLHNLVEKGMAIGCYLGNELVMNGTKLPIRRVYDLLALMGLLLYRKGIRKDDYMENLPYLYGQLLKTSDELHALYCKVVRNGDYPSQFVGSSLYQSAAETPIRTLNVLGQRIAPYYSWAKGYRLKNIQKEGEESWRAKWLYSQYESITTKLNDKWTIRTRFNDEEKAQLFIGYLAAFPKKNKITEEANDKEVNHNEQ